LLRGLAARYFLRSARIGRICDCRPAAITTGESEAMAGDAIRQHEITAAALRIGPYLRRTPVIDIALGGSGGETPISLKLELMQHSGSFKARGAFANLLMRPIPPAGVVAASGGNHGAAVAYAGNRLGIKAKIFVPRISSPAKIERIRGYGADLVVEGARYADALSASEAWAAGSGAIAIHAFDQRETLLGQGTIGREIEEQVPDLDTLLVSVGGGGLIAGIAAWYAGRIRVVGIEPEGSPTLFRALEAGRPVDADTEGVAADSLAPRRVGELVFPIAQRHVSQVVLVSDDAIRAAQQALWRMVRIVAEPGGAAAFAALVSGRYRSSPGERVGVVISGGNTVAVDFSR
jgi:threonine dehydratase